MHSKLLLLVPIVLAGVECLSTYSNTRAQQLNNPGNWTLGLPAFDSLLRRDDSPDSQVDYWVFTVRIGHGEDTELDDIRKYIQAELGSDRKKTKEKWARNVTGGIMWFYLKCSKGTAEHIVKQWEKSIQNFSSVEARIKEFEASLLIDPTIETLKAKMNGGDKDTDTDNADPKLHKRSYLLEVDGQRPETCMISKHPNAEDPAPDSPCTYETNSSQGRGVIVYVIDSGFDIRHTDFKDTNWAKDDEHIFIDGDDSMESLRSMKLVQTSRQKNPYHGSLVLSKLLGAKNGIAKSVTPVLVKYTSASGKHYPGWYVECLAEVLQRIENNMKKSEGSGIPGAGQYLILSNLQLPLPVGTSERTQLDEVFKKLRALNNVVYVSSAGNGNPPPGGQRRRPTPWKEQYRHDPILKSMVPMGYGYDDANYNLIIVGGTDHTGRIIFQTAPFVRVSAPAENIELAVGQVGFFRGAGYELSHGTSVSSPAVAGVLATYISAYGDTVLEAKDRLYRLAYPRADIQAMPEDQRKLYPPVVFNSFGRDPNAAKGKDNDCAVNQRRIIRRANGTATTVLEGGACPTPTSKNTKQEQPQGKFSLEPNATFCKVCMEAGGEVPVGGIIWIPEDCPCL
ncbi:hypothetical protein AOL_s00169g246 [Orbilia oligospora ATCC 24927]|uniref:Peptidase S8/S53 domain-containing protein n=1 Tax=Arthrobotrys oligospora (strain ATCC 24927 / CBS 115.81 / DSM 1491) TaxID=756982 RepID=G1XN43_ARTOA|nr:hypothetical protein AOL_s00169g246 [Orbilia oligospora ATCC 24927]EGX45640.1 hypothetical protein AOL_s00169g246 [Orbilia oligospora ATCC 24927]